MTGSAEGSKAESRQPIGSGAWRGHVQARQEHVLPSGRVVVSCAAPLGSGGLGRHLQEIVDALARREQSTVCICGSARSSANPSRHRRLRTGALSAALSLPPLQLGAAQRMLDHSREFDAYAARQMPAAEHLIAFSGSALKQIRAARRGAGPSISIVSATSHLRLLVRQHARAHAQYPLEGSWAKRLVGRSLKEYAQADRIYVASDYARESFLAEGFGEDALALFPLTPDPRYAPGPARGSSSTFDIVYVGGLSVVKGVPVLIDAVRSLPQADIRLVLVGGWASRGMRRFVESACAQDARITAGHGDPLPHLRAAALYVHPSYNDGFGYAPAEAMACGVPVIVTEDTGIKDLVEPGRNGAVLPTGDVGALTEAIEAAYRGELLDH